MQPTPQSVFKAIRAAEAIKAVELKVDAEAEAIEAAEVLEALNAIEAAKIEAAKVDTVPTDLWHEPEPERPSRCIDCFCQAMGSILMCIITSKFL